MQSSKKQKKKQIVSKEVKKVHFDTEYLPKNTLFSCFNLISQQLLFQNIFKLKEFYWFTAILYPDRHLTKPDEEPGDFRPFVKLIIQPCSLRSIFTKNNTKNKSSFKTFILSLDDFVTKCSEFLDIKSLNSQSFKMMLHHFQDKLQKKLPKIIIKQGDLIKLSSKFLRMEEQDDPFAKASAFYRLTEKNTFQDFKFENTMLIHTENDYLFDKNFNEIYNKHFIHRSQKFFNYRNYDDDPLDHLDSVEENRDKVFVQRYIDDDDAAYQNSQKPDVDRLDTTFTQGEHFYSRNRYYFKYKHQGTLCYIRLLCDTDLSGKKFINICYYHPNREQINYVNITERKLMVKT